jgi:hypothetical protein
MEVPDGEIWIFCEFEGARHSFDQSAGHAVHYLGFHNVGLCLIRVTQNVGVPLTN